VQVTLTKGNGITGIGLAVLISGISLALFWANFQYVGEMPGGNDFLVHWVGAKAFLLGQSPYADTTALEIQTIAYGRPAIAGEHELRVAYPLYAEFLFIPFAMIDQFGMARSVWMTTLEILTLAFAAMAWNFAGRTKSRVRLYCFILFSLIWYLGTRAVINGNAIILTGFFFLSSLIFLERSNDWLFGVCIALSTIKPQVVLIPIGCLLVWLVFARRWRAVFSFGVSILCLVVISAFFIPDWIIQNWREIVRYPSYNPPGTPATALAAVWGAWGNTVGWFLSIGVLVILAFIWFRARGKDWNEGVVALYWTIILAPLSGLQTDTGNEWFLLLPIAWLAAGRAGKSISLSYRYYLVLIAILIGLWWLFLATLIKGVQPQQHPMMLFPLPVFLAGLALWDAWRMRRVKTAVSE
jgi:hypothetical protein